MLKKVLIEGYSEIDRINFSTTKFSATAIRDKDGEINIEFNKPDFSISGSFGNFFITFFAVLLLKRFCIIPLILSHQVDAYWYLFPTLYFIFLMIYPVYSLRKTKGIDIFKNHGAEHKVVNYYLKHKVVPDIDTVRFSSRISRYCGISIFSSFILTQIIGFVVFIFADGFVIPEIVLLLVSVLFSECYPFCLLGMLVQHFSTAEPDDSQLELALAAFNAFKTKLDYNKRVINIANSVLEKFNAK